jgi:hypothetical protein
MSQPSGNLFLPLFALAISYASSENLGMRLGD